MTGQNFNVITALFLLHLTLKRSSLSSSHFLHLLAHCLHPPNRSAARHWRQPPINEAMKSSSPVCHCPDHPSTARSVKDQRRGKVTQREGGAEGRLDPCQSPGFPSTSPGQTLSHLCANIPESKPAPAARFQCFWHSQHMPCKQQTQPEGSPCAFSKTEVFRRTVHVSLPSADSGSESRRRASATRVATGHVCCSQKNPGKAHTPETISGTWGGSSHHKLLKRSRVNSGAKGRDGFSGGLGGWGPDSAVTRRSEDSSRAT